MWLINATTRRLERFNDERTLPPYAILSHTWGDFEVTLQQYQNALASSRIHKRFLHTLPGFSKIDASCMQACTDDLPYVWIDTCCVDKTSSAELSEAINSMYRWYQLAHVCYVYLEDIEGPPLHGDEHSLLGEFGFQIELAKARWFTRGWTLQEFLAPQHVDFYDKKWRRLGTKESLGPVLAHITGIDEAFLHGADLKEASIAKRMSWAARRETTKVEDVAYSLIGLFDVSMPLLYGEGAKAFQRLQEEIFRETDDLSLFAWQPATANTSKDPRELRHAPSNKGISVFAQHPREFSRTTNLLSHSSTGEPYTASGGKGVRLELPLLNIKGVHLHGQALRVAVLCCSSSTRDWDRPGIVIQELSSGHYMRHPAAGLVQIESCDVEDADMRQIYIRKAVFPAHSRVEHVCSSDHRKVAVRWY